MIGGCATRTLAAALACTLVSPVVRADNRKIQILQSEGRVDVTTRNKIDAAIFKLAKTTDAQVSPGDITMTDAATAVGCKVETSACKDEILNMLAVDEVVYAIVTPKPGGTEVVAYRVAKGGVVREAKATIQAGGSPDTIDGVAPLFFAATTAQLPTNRTATEPTSAQPSPVDLTPPSQSATLETTTTTITTTRPQPLPPGPDEDRDTITPARHKFELAGMIIGGSSVLLGILSWGKAGAIQRQIDDAPTRTAAELDTIRGLEHDGDGYAGLGNVLFLGGLAFGGVATYLYIRDHKTPTLTSSRSTRQPSATTAHLTPVLFDHGAGVTFTIGGLP